MRAVTTAVGGGGIARAEAAEDVAVIAADLCCYPAVIWRRFLNETSAISRASIKGYVGIEENSEIPGSAGRSRNAVAAICRWFAATGLLK
jgi:hypothetical protein